MVRRNVAVGVLTIILAWPAPPAAAEIHVTNGGADYRLTVFGNGANGNVAPAAGHRRRLRLSSLSRRRSSPTCSTTSSTSPTSSSNSITVYPLSASGDQPPLRTPASAPRRCSTGPRASSSTSSTTSWW